VESIADSCIDTLIELIDLKINYVIQEAVIVIKDIFRRYPGKYERVIPKLCEDLDVFTEPEAKSAIVWILGQYANRIDNASELFEDLSYNFLEEPTEVCFTNQSRSGSNIVQVQLSILTGSVKLFLHKPNSDSSKEVVHKVLKWATEEVDNPDLRDRGYMYWRLLAHSTNEASSIVLNDQLIISTDTDRMERGALDQLLLHTGTLSSIYHKNPDVSCHISNWRITLNHRF
jgi:vesicle coat complex subunit